MNVTPEQAIQAKEKTEYMKAIQSMPDQAQYLFRQLKLMITNGQRLTNEEALALANFGYREGLDPLNGECWILKDKEGKVTGCAVGIKGLCRKADETTKPGHSWFTYFKDITSVIKAQEPDVMIAYECEIRDTEATEHYVILWERVNKMGMTTEDIIETVGRPPVWRGIGIFRESEKNQYRDAKYPPMNRAKKRALADAIKGWRGWGYDVRDENGHGVTPSEEFIEDDEIAEEIDDGEFTPINPDEETRILILTRVKYHQDQNTEKMAQNKKGALIGTLSNMMAPGDVDMKRHMITKYLFGKSSSKELTDAEDRKSVV